LLRVEELARHLLRGREDEGVLTGGRGANRAEDPVADVHELPELGEVGTDEGEVVALVEAAQPQDALLAVLVPQRRPERIHRVGGIGDQTPLSHDLGSRSNAAYLWIDRMDVEVACHGPTLARRRTVMKR